MFSEKKVMVQITEYNEVKNSAGDLIANLQSPKYDYKFENLRMNVKIEKLMSGYGNRADVQIYGVSKEKMDKMTTLSIFTGFITSKRLRIYMDDGAGYSLRYEGFITFAVPVYNKAPDTYIQIESSAVAFPNAEKISSYSTPRVATVAQVLEEICAGYGVHADTSDVPFKMADRVTYAQDTLSGRINAACMSYGLIPVFTGTGFKFFKKGGYNKRTPYILTPEHYNGFPSFSATGISIETDHMIDYQCGDRIKIVGSVMGFANDTWVINKITYNLQPMTQNGKWDIKLDMYRAIL